MAAAENQTVTVASSDEGAIVGGPVLDAVFRLVRGMDSRLHPPQRSRRLGFCETSRQCWSLDPAGARIHAPTPHIAAANEGPIVGRPIRNAVLRLVRGMNLRLHLCSVAPAEDHEKCEPSRPTRRGSSCNNARLDSRAWSAPPVRPSSINGKRGNARRRLCSGNESLRFVCPRSAPRQQALDLKSTYASATWSPSQRNGRRPRGWDDSRRWFPGCGCRSRPAAARD